jgi:hypothetical protein
MRKYKIGWKIIDVSKGYPKFLFKGLGGSRTIELDKPLHAEIKTVHDNGVPYVSGFHVIPYDIATAKKYVTRFKNTKGRVLVRVHYRKARKKPTHNSLSLLAEVIKIDARDIKHAIPLDDLK